MELDRDNNQEEQEEGTAVDQSEGFTDDFAALEDMLNDSMEEEEDDEEEDGAAVDDDDEDEVGGDGKDPTTAERATPVAVIVENRALKVAHA